MILHTVPALFGDGDGITGGAERYVLELARHMAHEVPTRLVTFGAKARTERIGALDIRVVGGAWHVRGQRSNPFAAALLGEVLKADVVHCHQNHTVASSTAAILSRLSGRKVFATDLGGGGWDLSSYVSTDRLFNGHLHISQYSRRISGHDSKPWAHVIWGGVDCLRFTPAQEERRHVLFVGRLLPHKGVDLLLRALPADMRAVVFGPAYDARYLNDLRALAEGKSVTFVHGGSDDMLVRAYQEATCVVLPSTYDDMYGQHTDVPELLGQSLLEGMACGAPAIATNVASLPEIVEDGVTGYVVPTGRPDLLRERLVALHGHADRQRNMGSAARQSVMTRFTWSAVVERCLRLYNLGDARATGGKRPD